MPAQAYNTGDLAAMRFRVLLSLTTLFLACFTIAVWSSPPLPDLEQDGHDGEPQRWNGPTPIA
jgi:hypothetical protein